MKILNCTLLASAIFLSGCASNDAVANNTSKGKEKMKYELSALPYQDTALEPYIDAATVRLHHDKHQAAYVAKLNAALESEASFKFDGTVQELISNLSNVPESIRGAVRNNGGGVWNHEFYWLGMSGEKSNPSPELLTAINNAFGSIDNLKKKFGEAAVGQFGSGWAWIGVDKDGSLKICSTPNQDTPLMGKQFANSDIIPILAIDVWEHAYYLKYQNRRPDYVEAFWNVINWSKVSKRYEEAVKNKKATL